MGLRCLLGHDFGEPETERQRNEEGNEVVVTVREVKTCQTCGETRVVSENKEIKSIEQLRRSAVGDDDPYGSSGRSGGSDSHDQYGSSTAEYGTDQPSSSSEQGPGTSGPSTPGAPTGSTNTPNDGTGPIQSGDGDGDVADAIQNAETGASETEAPTDAADDEGVVVDEGDDETPETDPAPTHAAADPAPQADDRSDVDDQSDAEDPAADPTEEDAVILDDDDEAPSEAERKQWEETADPEEIPGNEEPDPEPEGDDAVIMDADAASAEPETTEDGYTPWPDQHAEDEGHDADVPDDQPADVDFGGGLTPAAEAEETADEDAAAADADSPRSPVDEVADAGRTATDASRNGAPKRQRRPAPETNVDLGRAASDASLEYHCPDCGLTRAVGNSSMRAGDICPECHRGYITERPRQS